MTIKQIALLTAKAGMSRDDFIERYEGGHVPLVSKVIPYFDAYRRNFVVPNAVPTPAHVESAPPPIGFDVVTELWFRDKAALDALFHTVTTTDVGARIDEDETHFFNRSRMVMTGVEEHRTPEATLAPRPAGQQGRPPLKFIIFLGKRPDQTREEFIDYYERQHAPFALDLLQLGGAPLFAEYARNYPLPGQCHAIGEHSGSMPPPCDGLTEYSFWNESAMLHFLDLLGRDEVAGPLGEDEARLCDRASFRMSRVEEHGSAALARAA